MSDEEQSEPPKKGVDLSKLEGVPSGEPVRQPNPVEMHIMKQAARATDTMKAITASSAIQDAMKSITGSAAMEDIRRATANMDAMKKALGPTDELQERMRALTGQFGSESGIGKVAKQLQDQHRSIDAMRLPPSSPGIEQPRIPKLHIPPNPIHETNVRLERIEQRFEQMLNVAADGAEIATGLQAHAAEFLVKFENAASDNDRSAARAIRLGVIAVLIALAMPLAQILYTELWRVPQDSASMEAVISDMQSEIARLRQTQIEAANRIAVTLIQSDQQMVEALQDVARSLAAPPPAPAEVPVPTK
ncbi:MAG: hypothetical protein KKC72_07515 [Alphaproteobacteria bacterium]|nr:hypothetical protein [Alphaproteobacteria bacterium]MBU1837105.1 hypothetical protein [Alphaproteobacteria bacterium]